MLLSNYAIKFRTAVVVFVGVLIMTGVYNYTTLPREGSPDITIPFVFVTAVYEGTAPSEMEKLVTIPIEKQLNDLENIKEMRSTSSDSVSLISVEFMAGQDIDMALQKAKDKVDLAAPDLPEDLDEPTVQALNFSSDIPILRFALSGDISLQRLKGIAEDIQDAIDQVPGVREAVIAGTREREIRIELDLERIAAYGIPLSVIMGRIQQENTTSSVGSMEMRGDKFQVRVPGEFRLPSEISAVPLMERHGEMIYLRDVAAVVDTHKDAATISRLNREPAVSISVTKRSGENVVSLIDQIKEILADHVLPPEVSLTIVLDESDYVDMMIEELENNIASGFLLVVGVLFLFMGRRNSLFVALAIPLSMLIAFTMLPLFDLSLNMIVLFSLVLAVGMLVDNAIVIVENIYRNHTMGLSRIEAAKRGASEVAWPVITSTLTTCAAFSPLLFWPDIMGQFMGYMPRTLIIILFASLFVAIVVNPAICSLLVGGKAAAKREAHVTPSHWFIRAYERLLRGALAHRGIVLVLSFLFLILTVEVYALWGKGQELFPDIDPRNATVEVKYPQGTSLEKTDEALRRIELSIANYDDVKFFLSTAGMGAASGMGGAEQGTHLGSIHVEFVDLADRSGSSSDLVRQMRDEIGAVPGAEMRVEKQREGPPAGAPVSIEISGDDFDTLADLSAGIVQRIVTIPGLVDVRDDHESAVPEIRFKVDRSRAALLGVDTAEVGMFLRAAIYGIESSKFRADEEEYDITLRLPEDRRDSVAMLDEIVLPTRAGGSVPLSSVGSMEYVGGVGSIRRKDQKRVVTISGDNHVRGVDKILKDVRNRLGDIDLPSGYAIDYAGDTEEMRESMAFLSKALLVALGLILVILVLQFNSAMLPPIILISIILSLIGVMWGLLICRLRFGVIMTGVGVISLAGIVVNNAIVLVDCIRQQKAKDLTTDDAVVAAGRLRLRPVLLTAVTTILGLIPMAIGYSLEVHTFPPSIIAGAESSQWWAPMAVAVIFGLAVSTVLTLVLVPVMYSLSDSLSERLRKWFSPTPANAGDQA